jgi:wyosine [tRNA(Phe)-imidazoG37] synthetase (radical SAM superfamily)
VERTAAFVGSIEPLRAYLSVTTRPPAEPWVRAPSTAVAGRATDIFLAMGLPAISILEDVEDPFAVTGDPVEGLLGIVAVHPMTEAAAREYLDRAGAASSTVADLLDQGRVVRVRHGGAAFIRAAR